MVEAFADTRSKENLKGIKEEVPLSTILSLSVLSPSNSFYMFAHFPLCLINKRRKEGSCQFESYVSYSV